MGQGRLAEEIQNAIDQFYVWLGRLVAEGKMKRGQRLAAEGKTVSRKAVTDGPFGEAKEVIGGYWLIVAHSLDEAARDRPRQSVSATAACSTKSGRSTRSRPVPSP